MIDATDRLLVTVFGAGLLVATLGLLHSSQTSLVGEAAVLAALSTVALRSGREGGLAAVVAGAGALVILLIYLVDAMGDNYAGAYPFLLGLRKSFPGLLLLVVGLLLPARLIRGVLAAILAALLAGAASAVALHVAAPELEAGIARSADEYTALIQGETRLQGVYAGPFHAAMAGVLLILLAVLAPARTFPRWVRAVSIGLGAAVLAYAAVRTAWPALVTGLAAGSLGALPDRRRRRGLHLAFVVAAVAVSAVVVLQQAVPRHHEGSPRELASVRGDSRLANRIAGYREAARMFDQRPALGWGAGSAGDTLDRFYTGKRRHVTSHNVFVKYAVETGAIGLAAMLAAVVAVGAQLVIRCRCRPLAPVGLAVLLAFLTFGATGSAVDAVPVSWAALLLVGMAAGAGGVGDTVAAAAKEPSGRVGPLPEAA